jgi:dCMP deaminase
VHGGPIRPTWDEYGMILATAASTRAACSRRQVGAVITDQQNRVIATGYNGVPSGQLNCSEGGCPRGRMTYDECPAYGSYSNCKGYHAERNARDTAVARGLDLTGCNIYVTHDPCADCTALIEEAGITRVISPNKSG